MLLPMKLTRTGDRLTVELSGFLTYQLYWEAQELLSGIDEQLGREESAGLRSIEFDLESVERMDSHWLGIFVQVLYAGQEKGAKVVLLHPQPTIRRLFEVVRFNNVFDIRN